MSRRSYIILAFHGQNIAKLPSLTAAVNWIYSDAVPDDITIPLPVSVEKEYQWDPNWQWADSFGKRILNLVDPERNILTPAQQRIIVGCETPDAITALLKADLGDTLNPDLAKAHNVFGNLSKHGLSPARMIITLRFYTMAQLMQNIHDARSLLAEKKVSRADRIAAIKLANDATFELNKIVNTTQILATKLKHLDKMLEPRPEEELKPAPKPWSAGVAPDLE